MDKTFITPSAGYVFWVFNREDKYWEMVSFIPQTAHWQPLKEMTEVLLNASEARYILVFVDAGREILTVQKTQSACLEV